MIDIEREDELKMDEMQDYELYESTNGHKINRYEITTYVTQRTIESLIKWVEKGKIIIPDFQRDYVWPKSVASKLIDSVLLNLPIPNIFLYKINKDGEEIYYVIDGFQRIQTLKFFKEGIWNPNSNIKKDSMGFKEEQSTVFKINYKSSEWMDKSYESLNSDDKFNYDEYLINLTIFEQSNPDNKKSMFEVFERINTGSEKLSEQEIRNAIYSGKFLNLIRSRSKTQNLQKIIENDPIMRKRQNYVDLFLRFVSYYYLYETDFVLNEKKISVSKRDTLNDICDFFNKRNENEYIKYIDDVSKAIDIIYEFNKEALYGKKRNENKISTKIHSVFAEALVISVIKNNFEINISKNDFDKFKLELWDTTTFEEIFVQQTTAPKNIQKRIDKLIAIINNKYE